MPLMVDTADEMNVETADVIVPMALPMAAEMVDTAPEIIPEMVVVIDEMAATTAVVMPATMFAMDAMMKLAMAFSMLVMNEIIWPTMSVTPRVALARTSSCTTCVIWSSLMTS